MGELMTPQFPFEIFWPLQPNDETTEEEAVEMSDLEKAKKLLQPMAGQPCLLRYLSIFDRGLQFPWVMSWRKKSTMHFTNIFPWRV